MKPTTIVLLNAVIYALIVGMLATCACIDKNPCGRVDNGQKVRF